MFSLHKKPFCIQVHAPLIFKLPAMGKFNGLAVWPFIFFDKEIPDRSLIEHEKIHIRQQLKGWLIGFYIKYLYFNFRYGYKRNPYEVEAYKHEDDWKK